MYRIIQKSLANIAKHAPQVESMVALKVLSSVVKLSVINDLPVAVSADRSSDGRGLRGDAPAGRIARGVIDIGPSEGEWAVRADLPLSDGEAPRLMWPYGS